MTAYRGQPQALASGLGSGRLYSWLPDKRTLTAALVRDAGVTLGRCRDAVRNIPWAARAADAFASAAAGYGIKPSPLVKSKLQRRRMLDLWRDWTYEADADDRSDFYGLQALAARELFVAGEVFIRRRARRLSDGLVLPFQVQLLRAEMLPFWLSGEGPMVGAAGTPVGNTIRAGVEFDRLGRRAAYHFLREDPGDALMRSSLRSVSREQFVRVPADEVLHLFKPIEPGQVRGLPGMAAGLVRLYEVDTFVDANVARYATAALFSLIIKPAFDGTDFASRSVGQAREDVTDASGGSPAVEDLDLRPCTVVRLQPGEEVEVPKLPDANGEFDAFMFRTACDVAAAFGIPYSLMTGDMRNANYSSERAATVAFRRDISQFQHSTMVYQMCRPMWRWFLDAAVVLSGALSLPGYRSKPREYLSVDWIPPAWEWVDPLKDIQAQIMAMQAGILPRSHVQAALGYDAEELDEEIAACKERADQLGIDVSTKASAPIDPAPDKPNPDGSADNAKG